MTNDDNKDLPKADVVKPDKREAKYEDVERVLVCLPTKEARSFRAFHIKYPNFEWVKTSTRSDGLQIRARFLC